MSVAARDLHGAWQLVSWSYVYDDGRADEYPLGPDARGHIVYTPDGHVAALLMRAKAAGEGFDSFGYSGRYEVRDGAVFHSIEVATNPALVGFTSNRRIALDGDSLVLAGPDFSAGTARTQKIVWRRAVPRAA